MATKHYTKSEIVEALEDLCIAVGERRFLDQRDFPADLYREMVRRSDDSVARQLERANRVLAWWKDYCDDYEDDDDDLEDGDDE